MLFNHSCFIPDGNGITEYFFAASISAGENFSTDAVSLLKAYDEYIREHGCSENSEVLLRFHLSDITNQTPVLDELLKCRQSFISIVGQPPASGRIALESWHWCGTGLSKNFRQSSMQIAMQNYSPVWFKKSQLDSSGSFDQTAEEFDALENFLRARNGCVADHTVRTWLYCRDVDNNYAGLVKARNEFFAGIGLTGKTHFIASTGIEGHMPEVNRLVKMDSLSYPGALQSQMHYLSAPEMLSPTTLYGVSFERGTRMIFGDRSHLFISGTASIDKEGMVVHPGDVLRQTSRMMDNVEALLQCGDAQLSDVRIATLYLRDIADAPAVTAMVKTRLGNTVPLTAVKAPVCRPAWLVELECIAINTNGSKNFAVLR
ncbi:MAG: hypothetical protein IKA71_08305 [Lentisphaeria bacterium]|nr:hypothetical protein [Lentisphaeria bacterium]